MIASARGVWIAWGVAMALAGIAVVDGLRGAPGPVVVDRALVPGFDAAQVTALDWGAVRIVRGPAGWRWAPPGPEGPAEARTIDEVLAALRGGSWQRRLAGAGVGAPVATLRVERGGAPPLVLALEAADPVTAQQRLRIGDRVVLVDAWLGRALAPPPLALRVARPLAVLAGAAELAVVTRAGSPAVIVRGPQRLAPSPLALDPGAVGELAAALEAVTAVALPPAHAAAGTGVVLRAGALEVRDAGACGSGRQLLAGSLGLACVDELAWAQVLRAADRLAAPAAELIDRRPLAAAPRALRLADGAALEVAGLPRLPTGDADPARVAALVLALTTPGAPAALPAAPPTATLFATPEGGGPTIALALYPPDLVARAGEPLALRIGPGAWQLLAQPSGALLDPVPWREEPTTIIQLDLDDAAYRRGSVIGEWQRTAGRGPAPPAATIDAAARALAAPELAARPADPAARQPPAHALVLHVAPVGGAPTTRTLRLHDLTRCDAVVDQRAVRLPAATCALVRALR